MKKMKDMSYHFGLRMRLYPSLQQKNIIKRNSDAARFVYNRCVAIGNELRKGNYLKRKENYRVGKDGLRKKNENYFTQKTTKNNAEK